MLSNSSYDNLISMKKPGVFFTILFVIAFITGFSFFYSISDTILNEREVASIEQQKMNAVKFLETDSLRNELSKKIKISTLEGEKIIALEGFSSQLCKSFPTVELVFDAYGVSVSGEPSQFKVTADCIPGQDPAEIALIKIPVAKLLKEKARNAQFKFSEYSESFELINTDEWAKTWLLSKIVFKSISESKAIQVANDRLNYDQPIVLEF